MCVCVIWLTARLLLQLWNIYLALPTEFSKQVAERKKLQKEYLTIRRDLNATSSQDQFAKWAKLRRQHDKLMEQLEQMSTFFPFAYR